METGKDIAQPFTDYNTQRKKLMLPEYGRHIQKMIQYVAQIEDREKRNEQIMAVISVMGNLNPHLRDVNDFKHKLWDHVHIISDFAIDIDAPYPTPSRESFNEKPEVIPYPSTPVKIMHYGRNVQDMVVAIASRPDSKDRDSLIVALGNFMKRQYLIWNKESVTDELIFRDIVTLSKGGITIKPYMKLADIQKDVLQEIERNAKSSKSGKSKKKKKKSNPR
jgi:hypothetical protein